ncbi:hypothetical protein B8W95_14135, partial [Staphylococcus pasteuri]
KAERGRTLRARGGGGGGGRRTARRDETREVVERTAAHHGDHLSERVPWTRRVKVEGSREAKERAKRYSWV